MIPVSIEGVRRNFTTSSIFMYSVFWLDESGQRCFIFNIDRQEALSLVTVLYDLPVPRPQTINMMVEALALLNSILQEVRIEHFSRYHRVFCVNGMLNRLGSVRLHRIRDGVFFYDPATL
jgi:bifunctional DNase/RNase